MRLLVSGELLEGIARYTAEQDARLSRIGGCLLRATYRDGSIREGRVERIGVCQGEAIRLSDGQRYALDMAVSWELL